MKSFLKYPGAKWSIADWIIRFFPEHRSYLEPFLGSGAVLSNKPPSAIETVNDMDGEIVNLFECIRRDPERLAREIYFTPYSRQIYENTYRKKPRNRFERARQYCIRCNMGHGFRANGERTGWKNDIQGRERSYALRYWNGMPEQIIEVAERLKKVQIENRPAVELIERFNFPNVLIYADPPYLLSTRHGKQYRHEMTESDHAALLDTLKNHRGSVIISGYKSELYDDMLQGWHTAETESFTQTMTRKTEVIWANFEIQEQLTLECI